MVVHAKDYEWSSYRQHAGIESDVWLDKDPTYLSLSDKEAERNYRYMDYINGVITQDETQLIQQALQRGQLTGTNRFTEQVERKLGCRIENRGPGRPRREMK